MLYLSQFKWFKNIRFGLLVTFLTTFFFSQTGWTQVLPSYQLSAVNHQLPTLRYLSINPANPNNYFNFLMDKGSSVLLRGAAGDETILSNNNLTAEAKKLINYFFLGITLPSDSFWVNLQPKDQERMTSKALSHTDMGKVLLEQDLLLKKDVAKYLNPDNPVGKKFWEALYSQIDKNKVKKEKITTSQRVWITPDKATVIETADGAFVSEAKLKVLLENEYLKISPQDQIHILSEKLMKEIVIPQLVNDVNTSSRYTELRQVYYSLVLAGWFKGKNAKQTISDVLLREVPQSGTTKQSKEISQNPYVSLINSQKTEGLQSQAPWSKDKIFQEYLNSYSKGEYNLKRSLLGMVRMYFSGGIAGLGITPEVIEGNAPLRQAGSAVADLAQVMKLGEGVSSSGVVVSETAKPAASAVTVEELQKFFKEKFKEKFKDGIRDNVQIIQVKSNSEELSGKEINIVDVSKKIGFGFSGLAIIGAMNAYVQKVTIFVSESISTNDGLKILQYLNDNPLEYSEYEETTRQMNNEREHMNPPMKKLPLLQEVVKAKINDINSNVAASAIKLSAIMPVLSDAKKIELLDKAIQGLGAEKFSIRMAAVNTLKEIKDIRALDALVKALSDGKVREAVANVLIKIGKPVIDPLIREIQNSGDNKIAVKKIMIDILHNLGVTIDSAIKKLKISLNDYEKAINDDELKRKIVKQILDEINKNIGNEKGTVSEEEVTEHLPTVWKEVEEYFNNPGGIAINPEEISFQLKQFTRLPQDQQMQSAGAIKTLLCVQGLLEGEDSSVSSAISGLRLCERLQTIEDKAGSPLQAEEITQLRWAAGELEKRGIVIAPKFLRFLK